MVWKYALAALAGAVAAWLWQSRCASDRKAGARQPRGVAPEGGAEFGAVVEELVSAAEELMGDLRQRQGEIRGLLSEADERIAGLRQALGSGTAPRLGQGPSEEKVQAAAALVAAARLGQEAARLESGAEPETGASKARTAKKSASRSAKAKAAGAKPKRPTRAGAAAAPPEEPRHQDVLSLAQRGLGPAEIARLTGRTTGEVQLILGLNRSLH